MATRNFEMTIRLSTNQTQKILIAADDPFKAKAMAEMQYGKGTVISNPVERR